MLSLDLLAKRVKELETFIEKVCDEHGCVAPETCVCLTIPYECKDEDED